MPSSRLFLRKIFSETTEMGASRTYFAIFGFVLGLEAQVLGIGLDAYKQGHRQKAFQDGSIRIEPVLTTENENFFEFWEV